MAKKILIVEDNADTRDLMVTLLCIQGFMVVTAEDGLAGLEVAQTERPDLIISDINMPRLNGLEMVSRLRQTEDFKSVPIVALTAYGKSVADDAIKAGADRVHSKPVDYDSFLQGLKALLD
jgi:two-component system cell cycle response regulator DivK